LYIAGAYAYYQAKFVLSVLNAANGQKLKEVETKPDYDAF
jgi:hypothetical protein